MMVLIRGSIIENALPTFCFCPQEFIFNYHMSLSLCIIPIKRGIMNNKNLINKTIQKVKVLKFVNLPLWWRKAIGLFNISIFLRFCSSEDLPLRLKMHFLWRSHALCFFTMVNLTRKSKSSPRCFRTFCSHLTSSTNRLRINEFWPWQSTWGIFIGFENILSSRLQKLQLCSEQRPSSICWICRIAQMVRSIRRSCSLYTLQMQKPP